jgi:hypothetical protein
LFSSEVLAHIPPSPCRGLRHVDAILYVCDWLAASTRVCIAGCSELVFDCRAWLWRFKHAYLIACMRVWNQAQYSKHFGPDSTDTDNLDVSPELRSLQPGLARLAEKRTNQALRARYYASPGCHKSGHWRARSADPFVGGRKEWLVGWPGVARGHGLRYGRDVPAWHGKWTRAVGLGACFWRLRAVSASLAVRLSGAIRLVLLIFPKQP